MTRTLSKRDNVETMNRKLSRNQSVIEKQTRYKKIIASRWYSWFIVDDLHLPEVMDHLVQGAHTVDDGCMIPRTTH